MKNLFQKTFSGVPVILACILILALTGCEGSDTKKTITDTVEQVMSGDVVKKGEQMKKDVDQAMKEEARRLLKMDKETRDGASDENEQKE